MSEYLLGSEKFIDKIVLENKNIASNALSKINDLLEMFKNFGTGETKEYLRLKKAESLYMNAVKKAGYKYVNGRIEDDEEESEVDTDEEIKYNRRKRVRYISYDKVGMDAVRYIRSELAKLYENEDGVADGIAIESEDQIYVVDSGCDNGDIEFVIRKIITIKDSEFRAEYARRKNNDSLSKGYISDGLSARFRSGYVSYRRSDRRQSIRRDIQTDSRESEYNQ